jgi:hypothetical protein
MKRDEGGGVQCKHTEGSIDQDVEKVEDARVPRRARRSHIRYEHVNAVYEHLSDHLLGHIEQPGIGWASDAWAEKRDTPDTPRSLGLFTMSFEKEG